MQNLFAVTMTDVGTILLFVATIALAAITAVYVRITRNTLKEVREARDAETRPNVIAYFDVPHDETWADFIVENIGKTLALDVKMEIDPPLQNGEGQDMMELPMIMNGIPMLLPGRNMRTTFAFTDRYFHQDLPMTYNVKVTYRGGMDNKQRESICVADLSVFDQRTHIVRYRMHDLVRQVEKLTREVSDIRRQLK